MKKNYATLFMRISILLIALIFQIVLVVLSVLWLNDSYQYFYFVTLVIGILLANIVVNTDSNPSYKIAWIIPLLALPLFGVVLYFFFGKRSVGTRRMKKLGSIDVRLGCALEGCGNRGDIQGEDKSVSLQSDYITNVSGCPPYKNTETKYFSLGEEMYEEMLLQLASAEKFIFLEYFIISNGAMWNGIFSLLERKASEGVDVRVIYDDVGSLTKLSPSYDKYLRKKGIKCRVFNPLVPKLSVSLNNRNHRKILVVDGNVAFTGGINIADEYINANKRKYHWKDGGIMLKGDAVRTFTDMFLSMWGYWAKCDENFEDFAPTVSCPSAKGFVQPFNDTPIDSEGVGENVYLNLIQRANKYIYITTPYLIINNEMETALKTAAKSGVDVRIITPGVGDKAAVHAMTRSYYDTLVDSGVKIYEYTPGFIHSKNVVCDDELAVIGSINFDYRSLYLQFECAAWLYSAECIEDIKKDFLETAALSREITPEICKKVPLIVRTFRSLLRAYAPLL